MPSAVDAFMRISPGIPWLLSVFLLSLRLGATFLMTPILAPGSVPTRVRVLIVLGLSTALSLGLPATPHWAELIRHPGALFQACFVELALGSTLACGILMAFAAFSTAGRLLDIQIGFGLGQVFDPTTNTRMPILTNLFNQAGVLIFFLINGHHALLRGLVFSLERFPLGRSWPVDAAIAPILKQAGGMFGISFALAAPVVFCVLLVEMALGALARNLPQINMLTLGIPVKVVVGLLTLFMWFSAVGPVFSRIYTGIYRTWDSILAPLPVAEAR